MWKAGAGRENRGDSPALVETKREADHQVGMKRVKVARTAGFCMGVRRAMKAVLEAARTSEGEISVLGPLVHNHQAMEMLAARKVKVLSEPGEAQGGVVCLRAHGVPPEIKEALDRPGVEVMDLTCPHVRKAQRIVERHARAGDEVLILGDPGHAEVVGLLGYARGKGHVVSSKEDLESLPPMEKVCVVAQTTQSRRRFAELAPLIRERFPRAEIYDTVCSATDERQAEVRALAEEVDAVIVVGGKHSANTVRLAEIAREEGVPAFHIETAAELDRKALSGFRTVGVTAGASTPNWVFRAVVDEAERLLERGIPFLRTFKGLLALGVHSYLYIGAGSAALAYAALLLLRIPVNWNFLLIPFCYVISMHLLNRFTDRQAARINDPRRMRLLERYQAILLPAALLSGLATLVLAAPLGTAPFLLALLSLAAGVSYNIKVLPAWLAKRVGFKKVKEIPASKDIFLALAWATVSVLLPVVSWGSTPWGPATRVFLLAFLLVFIRSIVYDVKDLEGDRIVGKETLPLLLGRKRTDRLLALSAGLLGLLVLASLLSPFPPRPWFLLPLAAYVLGCLLLFRRRLLPRGILFETVLDAQFLLLGLLAFLFTR